MSQPSATSCSASTSLPLNLVVLRGHLSSEEVRRTLPSGDQLCQFEVTVPASVGSSAKSGASTSPVVWFGERNGPTGIAGDDVLVIGQVRRRFYRAGGSTQSRTEVVASKLVLSPQRRSLGSAHKTASSALALLLGDQAKG